MYFENLLLRFRDRLNREVRNGRLTERGLARKVGLSQPHIHNVLKGRRILSPAVADRILRSLSMTVPDLLQEDPGDLPPPEPAPLKAPSGRRGRKGGLTRR
ncbi:MAG: helix-turn-helix transcriptional regulator [Bryobacteraceae bacterium]|nr:helix-turn-helix transcriptional regulator [Bryobacteraceae bacterium]